MRTGEGSKLDATIPNTVVAFEVDDFDPMCDSGRSVVVTGVSREITDPGRSRDGRGCSLSAESELIRKRSAVSLRGGTSPPPKGRQALVACGAPRHRPSSP